MALWASIASRAVLAAAPGEQFHRSSWTLKEGAPADIWAMIQGRDGYLWLGTGSGLYRFDGVRFERYALPSGERLPSNNVTALIQLPNGDIWVGFYSGGASVIRRGRLITYSPSDGFPDAMVINFALGSDGALWAATRGGLARFDGGRWLIVGKAWGYPAKRADWLLRDAEGTLWVTTGKRLMFLRKGTRTFQDAGMEVGAFAVLARAPNGVMWISDGLHGTRPLPGLSAGHPQVEADDRPLTRFGQAKRMLFDREGHLWATDADRGGLYQVAAPERAGSARALVPGDLSMVINHRNGLTADFAVPLVQDREGTIWIGTNLGLNSIRRNDVVVPQGIVVGPSSHLALAADREGTVWIVNAGTLYRVEHATLTAVMHGLPDVGSAQAGTGGVLWLGSMKLLNVAHGELTAIPLFDGKSFADIRAMAPDGAGGLWASFIDKGIRHYSGNRWLPLQMDPSLASSVAGSIAVDGKGRVWFGYSDNRIALLDGTSVRVFTSQDGLQVGNVATINVSGDEVLVGGGSGLARFRNGRFQSIPSQSVDALGGVSGIARGSRGDVWLNGSKGVVRIHAADLRRAFMHPGESLDYRLFDYQDGLPGIAVQENASPTAVADADGRLWFSTNQGVAWIDPAQIRHNPVPPPVDIRSVIAMRHSYQPSSPLLLPKRTTNVQIAYTALSLSIPERVRFRYRLDGVDEQWQDAGNRREAFYTNLGPGAHHFRVIAANDDGVWNEQGAAIDFTIRPLFYQTPWFIALCVLAALAVLLAMFLLRLRQMTLRVHDRLEERHLERERIARELHDTLLQAIQGLVLRFQAAAERIPADSPARVMVEKALDRADDVLIEGRDRVRDLRTSAEAIRNLPQALATVGEELAQGQSLVFRVIMEGPARVLNPIVREEVYQIGREALINAFLHADASSIEVEISHDPGHLRLRVRDDGVGIDQRILDEGSKPGHWGLSGMRERASRMGGKLDIWGRAGSGTEVDLQVPAYISYCDSRSPYLNWLRRLVSGGRYG